MSLCFAFPILHGSSSPLGLQISLAHTQPRNADLFANWFEIGCEVFRYMYSKIYCTGKSLLEAFIFASINPKYDNRLFI